MKRIIITLIILHTLAFILITTGCDLGLDNGDDLVGKWSPPTAIYTEYFRFYINGIGYYQKKNGDWESKDFIWSIKLGGDYKIVETDIGDYEYYFNYDKSRIYMRETGIVFFKEWVKRRD